MNQRRWTKEEVATMKQFFPHEGMLVINRLPKRTISAIRRRASILKLKYDPRRRFYRPNTEETLELAKIYHVGQFSFREIEESTDVNRATLREKFLRLGIPTRSYGDYSKLMWKKRTRATRFSPTEDQEITKIYLSGISASRMAHVYNCSSNTIPRAIRRCGEHVRDPSEAMQIRYPTIATTSAGYPVIHISRLGERAKAIALTMSTATGCILVHRLVMALHLRRPLTAEEVIHHKDEDKTNFKLNNLRLLTRQTHHIEHGGPYYRRWKEALAEIEELKAQIRDLE